MRKFVVLGALVLVLCAGQIAAQDAATPEPTAEATANVTLNNAEPQLRSASMLKDDGLLSGTDACSAPCWHGITPGVTTWDDAIAALKADTTFENINVTEDPQSSAKLVTWQGVGGDVCCRAYTQDGATVSDIFIKTTPDVSLGAVVQALGEPDYAIGSEFSETQAVMNLVYAKNAVVVYVFVAGPNADLSADSEVIGAEFLTPDEMTSAIQSTNLHSWQGYGSYESYSTNSSFDVTPVAVPLDLGSLEATAEATTSP